MSPTLATAIRDAAQHAIAVRDFDTALCLALILEPNCRQSGETCRDVAVIAPPSLGKWWSAASS